MSMAVFSSSNRYLVGENTSGFLEIKPKSAGMLIFVMSSLISIPTEGYLKLRHSVNLIVIVPISRDCKSIEIKSSH